MRNPSHDPIARIPEHHLKYRIVSLTIARMRRSHAEMQQTIAQSHTMIADTRKQIAGANALLGCAVTKSYEVRTRSTASLNFSTVAGLLTRTVDAASG
jgi:hypothetical protein